MVNYGDQEFREWVEKNNFDEQDLELIKKTAAKRAWLYYLITNIGGFYITLPFFLREWECYKLIKQGTFKPRYGLLFSLFKLAMVISFILIIPFIFCRLFYNGTKLSGLSFLDKHGFIGEGEQGRRNYAAYKEIKKRPRKIRNLVCIIFALVVSIICGIAVSPILVQQASADLNSFEAFLAIFLSCLLPAFFNAEIIGMIVTKIIVNKKYYASLSE